MTVIKSVSTPPSSIGEMGIKQANQWHLIELVKQYNLEAISTHVQGIPSESLQDYLNELLVTLIDHTTDTMDDSEKEYLEFFDAATQWLAKSNPDWSASIDWPSILSRCNMLNLLSGGFVLENYPDDYFLITNKKLYKFKVDKDEDQAHKMAFQVLLQHFPAFNINIQSNEGIGLPALAVHQFCSPFVMECLQRYDLNSDAVYGEHGNLFAFINKEVSLNGAFLMVAFLADKLKVDPAQCGPIRPWQIREDEFEFKAFSEYFRFIAHRNDRSVLSGNSNTRERYEQIYMVLTDCEAKKEVKKHIDEQLRKPRAI